MDDPKTVARLTEYLESHRIFSRLSADQLEILSKNATTVPLMKQDVLFRQGDDAYSFYIVREGEVSVQIPSVFGPPLVIQLLGADNVLGWSWLISPYKWTFEARAAKDSILLEFDGRQVTRECENYPAFGYRLVKEFAGLMSERLEASRQKMMDSWSAPGAI